MSESRPPITALRIDYVELPATDLAAMQSFYGAAFGWTFQSWGEDYASFSNAGLEGGFRRVDAPPPRGGVLVILFADDLDAAERAVEAAGGEIVERHEFPGGRRFQFVDPSGNELAVWTKQ
ncbi:MAG: VOC family protein [Planctomycetes bacterium]|nr:VOC family protein [Planctomycetota bacterium]